MPDQAQEKFALAAHPLNWYEVAKLLHGDAQSLHDAPQGLVSQYDGKKSTTRRSSDRSVYLLAAFALENLIKAFLIYENPAYIENGRLSREILNKHGLSELQQRCKKIPSPKRTLGVFKTLEVGVNSWARYPCATSANRQTDQLAVTPEFWEEYCRVFALYSERLESLLSRNWKGPHGIEGKVSFETGA